MRIKCNIHFFSSNFSVLTLVYMGVCCEIVFITNQPAKDMCGRQKRDVPFP